MSRAFSPKAQPRSLWMPYNAPRDARVALCLAGELRTLPYSWLLENWREAVLRPLQPAVFMHVSAECPGQHCCVRGHCLPTTSEEELQRVLHTFDPVSLMLANDSAVLHAATHPWTHQERRLTRRPALLMRWQGCLADITRLETGHRSGLPFEWVVRARPDVHFECLLPDLHRWPLLNASSAAQLAFLQEDYLFIASGGLGAPLLNVARRRHEHMVRSPNGSSSAPCLSSSRMHDPCVQSLIHEHGAAECEYPVSGIVRRVDCQTRDEVIIVNGTRSVYMPVAAAALELTGGWLDESGTVLRDGRTSLCHFRSPMPMAEVEYALRAFAQVPEPPRPTIEPPRSNCPLRRAPTTRCDDEHASWRGGMFPKRFLPRTRRRG